MNVHHVALKELMDTLRSRVYQGVAALFLLLVIAVHVAGTMEGWSPSDVYVPLAVVAQIMLPVGALAVAHSAISEERRSGSVKVLLGLPLTRGEVYAGKLVGLMLAMSLVVLVGFLLASVMILALAGLVPTGMAGFAVASLALTLAFTGLGFGLSTLWTSRRNVLLASGGLYGLMLIWRGLIGMAYLGMAGWEAWPEEEGVNAWFVLLERLNPLEAYTVVADAFVTVDLAPVPQDFGYVAHANRMDVAGRILGAAPFYVESEFSLVLLAAWFVVPVILGYLVFSRVDL